MKLKIYTPETCPPDYGNVHSRTLSLSVNRKTGVFGISCLLRKTLNLQKDDTVFLAQDETRPQDWYIAKTKNGYSLKTYSNKQTVVFINKSLMRQVLDSIKASSDCSYFLFLVSPEAVEVDGQKYFPIITRNILKQR